MAPTAGEAGTAPVADPLPGAVSAVVVQVVLADPAHGSDTLPGCMIEQQPVPVMPLGGPAQ